MRAYICTGKEGTMTEGKIYKVEAGSHQAAVNEAGKFHKKETNGNYHWSFYSLYFTARVEVYRSSAPPIRIVLPNIKEVTV